MSPMIRLPLTVELALLGFLRDGPLHGYEIRRRLSDPAGLGLVWRLKPSHLYALLARLQAEGHVTCTVQTQETRPPRKLFCLTQSGRDAFLHWAQSPVPHGRDLRLDFLTRFYFAEREGPACLAQLLQRQRAACRDWLRAQQAQAAAARDLRPFEWQVCQFRIGQIEAMLSWLDRCEEARSLTEAAPRPARPASPHHTRLED